MKEILENLQPTALEIIEELIDKISKNEAVESIPIANIVLFFVNNFKIMYNNNLQKHTNAFIESLLKQEISEKNLKQYKKKIKNNKKKASEELERVMLYLNKNIEIEKSELLAKFYGACVNNEITWEKFCEFATVIDKIFLEDLKILYELYRKNDGKNITIISYEPYKISRLISTGLISNYSGAIKVYELSNKEKHSREIWERNSFGEMFVKIAMKQENEIIEIS